MNKLLKLSSAIVVVAPIAATVVSCSSSSSPNYFVMEWVFDYNKIANEAKNAVAFNNEKITEEKLKKIVKNTDIDRFTKKAIDAGWFKRIAIEGNKAVVELNQTIKIDSKDVSCYYRLPNGSLTYWS